MHRFRFVPISLPPWLASCLAVWLAATLAACGPAQKQAPPPGQPKPVAKAAPRCTYAVRRLSAYGKGGARPQIAASSDAFIVAWEETADHRAVRVETFGANAEPLGPTVDVGDVTSAVAEPRVAAFANPADGFAVFWSTEQADTSTIAMRRVDRTGKPRTDVIPVVVAPGARALDAVGSEAGMALAWWNWSGTPHQLAVSFFDKEGHSLGRPVTVTRAPAPDPTVDIVQGTTLRHRAVTVVAWDETVDQREHVVVGDLGVARLEGRVDLGLGETPRMGNGVLVWERAHEQAIYTAPLGGGEPKRLVEGHLPAAAPRGPRATAICFLRDTDPTETEHIDELSCGDLVDGKVSDLTRVAVAARGIFSLQLAVGPQGRIGVAWQSQEEDDTAISFAAVTCPDVAAAAIAPK
ncbi:MAG: hypothetical protein JWN44_5542 [Myxococcales bacterium]|nr:hypothetical protein [Myxococcales bacterium]